MVSIYPKLKYNRDKLKKALDDFFAGEAPNLKKVYKEARSFNRGLDSCYGESFPSGKFSVDEKTAIVREELAQDLPCVGNDSYFDSNYCDECETRFKCLTDDKPKEKWKRASRVLQDAAESMTSED